MLYPRHSGSQLIGDHSLGLQEHTAPFKTVGTASQTGFGSPLSAQQLSTNFIKADPATKLSLVQDLVKS